MPQAALSQMRRSLRRWGYGPSSRTRYSGLSTIAARAAATAAIQLIAHRGVANSVLCLAGSRPTHVGHRAFELVFTCPELGSSLLRLIRQGPLRRHRLCPAAARPARLA